MIKLRELYNFLYILNEIFQELRKYTDMMMNNPFGLTDFIFAFDKIA